MGWILGSGVRLSVFPQESDVYLDMALAMLSEIVRNQRKGRPTALIVPVGPTGQYPVFARLVNELRISLKEVHLFNMDEYLVSPEKALDTGHPMSFHGRMRAELYDRLDPELSVPEAQRVFPEPGHEAEFDARIVALGGIDLCLGGLGINGHVAFNEPPEPDADMTTDAFASLPTRVLPISRETRTINAVGYLRGDIAGMPEWCITVGMKQILASRAVYLALNRPWQHGAAKRAFTGPVTARVPASLLQNHPDVRLAATEEIVQGF